MQFIYTILLALHIIAGTIALASGTIAFVARKGKGWHTRAGSFFYYAMLFTGFSALTLSILKFNPFLFIVGLFSLYLTITGYRSLHTLPRPSPASIRTDWLIWALSLLGTITFLVFNLLQGPGDLAPVLYVFCFILLGMLWKDYQNFSKPKWKYQDLLKRHISRMGGAYIATLTAFIVTNVQMEPAYLPWLLPTALITPVLIYFQYQYSQKGSRRKAMENQ